MKEIWKPVVGYEGIYEVSNIGRVKSLKRAIERSDGLTLVRNGRIKTLTKNADGYLTVKLSKNGVDERAAVHRLVYSAFCGEIPEGYDVNHIDFDRQNNAVENLEVMTHRDNVAYTVDAGRHPSTTMDYKGKNNPNYGNRKLSATYAADRVLSKEKQGRPGRQNGRCRAVRLTYQDGSTESFDYITECANALISRGITRQATNGAVSAIITAITKGKPYRKIVFEYI